MRFEQTGEVLHYLERFHEELASQYTELSEQLAEPRARMLLDYMTTRELEMTKAVRSFAHGSKDKSLKEWDPFTIDDIEIKRKVRDGLQPDADPDQLLGVAFAVAKWLEDLCLQLEGKSGTPEQKQLFASLRDRADREKHKLARNANMLSDF